MTITMKNATALTLLLLGCVPAQASKGTPTPHDAMCAMYATVPYVTASKWSTPEAVLGATPAVLLDSAALAGGRKLLAGERRALTEYLREPFVAEYASAAERFLIFAHRDYLEREVLAKGEEQANIARFRRATAIVDNIVTALRLLEQHDLLRGTQHAFNEGLRVLSVVRPSSKLDFSVEIFREVARLAERSSHPDAIARFVATVSTAPARDSYLRSGLFGERLEAVLARCKLLPSEKRPNPETLAALLRFTLLQWRGLPSKAERAARLEVLAADYFTVAGR